MISTTSIVPGLRSVAPKGHLLLITDQLSAPADFILHRALALHLKPHASQLQAHVLLVSLASEYAHWRAIASRSNVNLTHHLNTGSLTYIDALSISASTAAADDPQTTQRGYIKCPPLFSGSRPPTLTPLYTTIAHALRAHTHDTSLVIIDDMTLPALIGIPPTALSHFIRALRALCHRLHIPLLLRAHASPPSSSSSSPFDADPLLHTLLTTAHTHIEVRPLASGRSGAVSGDIALHIGPAGLSSPSLPSLSSPSDDPNFHGVHTGGRKSSVQYRLTDSGAIFFQKGMGAGVL